MAWDNYSPYWEGQAWGSDGYCLRCRRPRYYSDTCWVCDLPLVSMETARELTEEQARTIESELEEMTDTNVLVDRDAASYVNEVVMACPGEVGGLGYVKRLESGDLWVYEFCLIEQEADGGSVEFDDRAMALFLEAQAEREDFENCRLSWHSHGTMGTFWSSTDTGDAIEKYKKSGVPWLLSLLFNRKGEVATRLDVFDSAAIDHLWLEDLTYQVIAPAQIQAKAKADVKALVRKPKAKSYSSSKTKKKDDEDEKPDMTVIEGGRRKVYRNGKLVSDTPLAPKPKGKGRKERKRIRKEKEQHLASISDMTEREMKNLNNAELDELIAYAEEQAKEEELSKKSIHDMTDKEWLDYLDGNGVKVDDSTRALLAGKQPDNDDDWGGAI